MASPCNLALFENHCGGNGYDMDTRDATALAVRSTHGPGLESVGSGGIDKYYGYRCIYFDIVNLA